MNASSLLMVIKSRTFGILCTLTRSAVSSAPAITGDAEFFAPLIATVPCNGFPPLIRNLSIPLYSPNPTEACKRTATRLFASVGVFCAIHSPGLRRRASPRFCRSQRLRCSVIFAPNLNSLCECLSQIPVRGSNPSLGLSCVNSRLQHHQSHAQVVSRPTQSVFRGRRAFSASFHQNSSPAV